MTGRCTLIYQRKTDDEIRQLALDIALDKVFGSWMLDYPDEAGLVFLVLACCGPEQHAEFSRLGITAVYEYRDKAMPGAVNGLPSFGTMQLLDTADQDRLAGAVQMLADFQERFMEEPLQ